VNLLLKKESKNRFFKPGFRFFCFFAHFVFENREPKPRFRVENNRKPNRLSNFHTVAPPVINSQVNVLLKLTDLLKVISYIDLIRKWRPAGVYHWIDVSYFHSSIHSQPARRVWRQQDCHAIYIWFISLSHESKVDIKFHKKNKCTEQSFYKACWLG